MYLERMAPDPRCSRALLFRLRDNQTGHSSTKVDVNALISNSHNADWPHQFRDRRIELGRFIDEGFVSGLFEPYQFL